MATFTKADVAQRILEALGVLGAGQSPSAEDQNRVEERLQSEYDKLRSRGRAPWPITAVPDSALNDLVDFVAPRCASLFRVGPQQLQTLMMLAREAQHSLVRSVNPGPQGITQETKAY